ncbi:RNA 2',3'-cyclic phosphodiesterase [Methanogenium cariaci]|uniref:RNA 2',3'-cyclic phosphodiesterase n=1 Tax=Methanogenium cariaci TaxID=2197 RepID=UPI0007826FA4|nr:RNA 2',3'-cyclic phosphodiesterase [Methanogenium cariaci]
MVRAFFAVELTDDIRNQCDAVQDMLRHTDAKLNWVNPALAHITLKFLGDISDDLLHRVEGVMSEFSFDPAEMTVSGVQLHPRKRPRIVWADVSDNGWGGRDNGRRDGQTSCPPAGHSLRDTDIYPARHPRAYQTLRPFLRAALEKVAGHAFGEMRVDTITLKKSTLTPAARCMRISWRSRYEYKNGDRGSGAVVCPSATRGS